MSEVVTRSNDSAKIYLVQSGSLPDTTSAAVIDSNPNNNSFDFTAASCLGDVTGDGYNDLGVSLITYNGYDTFSGYLEETGIVAVYPGAGGATISGDMLIDATGYTIVGHVAFAKIGRAVRSGLDVDNDSVNDLLVSTDSSVQNTSLFYGPISSGVHTIATAQAELCANSHDNCHSMYNRPRTAGDLNGDGYGDFLVGYTNESNANRNEVALFLGMEN